MPTLFRCLVQTLLSQHIDGSWGCRGRTEETAYAILTLATLLVLPLALFFRPEIMSAMDRGRAFLKKPHERTPEYLWIEKVSYSSANLAEAYITAALYVPIDKSFLGAMVRELCSMHYKDLAGFGDLIEQRPLSRDPKWLTLASWIESRLCSPWLRKSFKNTWQPPAIDSYYEKTAFRWILANSRTGSAFLSESLCDIMSVSFLTEHIIALVDDGIASQNDTLLEQLIDSVNKIAEFANKNGYIFSKPGTSDGKTANTTLIENGGELPSHHSLLKDEGHAVYNGEDKDLEGSSSAADILSSFVDIFNGHHGLSGASGHDRAVLGLEVERFLQAQISRIEEGRRHQCCPADDGNARKILGNPAHDKGSAASLTGYPHMLAFATCLRACNGKDLYPTASQKHVAEDVRNGVATVFRLERDLHASRLTGGLFPAGAIVGGGPRKESREQLIELLSYEQSRLALAVGQLEKLGLAKDELGTIGIMIDVAELAVAIADLH